MAKYLTQEWLDENVRLAKSFPERAGATAHMQYRITNMPEGADDCWFYWVIDNGKLLEATLGQDPDAEFTMTVSYADNRLVQEGKLDPNAAFMQGKMKVTGNMAKLMSLMPLTASAEYKAIQDQVREVTDY
jgi:putative sterol carrier protein